MKDKSTKPLQTIPWIGEKLSKELFDLGYRNPSDLQGESPEEMYNKLCELRGWHIDRCVLYVFRSAVYYVNNKSHDPELLKWWAWKDKQST